MDASRDRRGRRATAIGVVGALGAAVMLAGAPSGYAQDPSVLRAERSAQSAPSISAHDAQRVVADYNAANTKNNAALDLAGQAAVETGPVRTIDDAAFRELRGRGASSLGGGFTIDKVRVWVPVQHSYPLQFLAVEQATDNGVKFRQLLTFTKASEGDAWKLSMAAQLVDANAPKLLADRDQRVQLLDADHASSLKVQPKALDGALANVWARAAGLERAPQPSFAGGQLTGSITDYFVNELSQTGINARVDFGFRASGQPVVGYRTADGGALCLFVVAVSATLKPVASDPFTQPASRTPFGGLVPPGQYIQIGYERLAIVAAVVPKQTSKAKVHVIAIYDGPVSATALQEGTSTA
jgi:hypothetical protein